MIKLVDPIYVCEAPTGSLYRACSMGPKLLKQEEAGSQTFQHLIPMNNFHIGIECGGIIKTLKTAFVLRILCVRTFSINEQYFIAAQFQASRLTRSQLSQ